MIAACRPAGSCTRWQIVLESSWKNEWTSGFIAALRRLACPGAHLSPASNSSRLDRSWCSGATAAMASPVALPVPSGATAIAEGRARSRPGSRRSGWHAGCRDGLVHWPRAGGRHAGPREVEVARAIGRGAAERAAEHGAAWGPGQGHPGAGERHPDRSSCPTSLIRVIQARSAGSRPVRSSPAVSAKPPCEVRTPRRSMPRGWPPHLCHG